MKLISLVIPCYNEEKGIDLLYKTVVEAVRPLDGKAQLELLKLVYLILLEKLEQHF